MKSKARYWWLVFAILVSLVNFTLTKLPATNLSSTFPQGQFSLLLSIVWFVLVGGLMVLFKERKYLRIDVKKILANKSELTNYSLFVLLGLGIFIVFNLTKYFNSVSYPLMFFLTIPIVEEVLFRGLVYGTFEKYSKINPVLASSVLFSLHHLQYYNYTFSKFIVFQLVYTFFLGLLFGRIRRVSGSIYLGIALHILINFVTLEF